MSIADVEALLHKQIEEEGEADLRDAHADLKKQTQFVPRNAPYPCSYGGWLLSLKKRRLTGPNSHVMPTRTPEVSRNAAETPQLM